MGIVEDYLHHLSAGRLNEALDCLAPGFSMRFAGKEFELDKGQTATALEWDLGVDGRLEWRVVEALPESVTVEGSEGNDFLDLIGVGRVPFRSVYTLDDGGRIIGQVHAVDWGDESMEAAMAPLIAWALEHAEEELRAIYPDGRMIYNRPMAERWVALARAWRRATSRS